MALEPLPSGDWLRAVDLALRDSGTRVQRDSRICLAWRDKRTFKNLTYADGWSVGRIWLAPGRPAIGITARRLYFLPSSDEVDKRREHEIISKIRPRSPISTEQIDLQGDLLQRLKARLSSETKLVDLDVVDPNLGDARRVLINASNSISPPESLNDLYRKYGFDQTPSEFTVSVCPLEEVRGDVADEFMERIKRAGDGRRLSVKVTKTSERKVKESLQAIQGSDESAREGSCVLFVLPKKVQACRSETIALFRSLEEAAVPFRRAYADDPLDYSIPDQLPSLLMAAGGRSHKSPTTASGKPVWTIGIDIGHRPERQYSPVVLTLVDPDGGLVSAWSKRQPRDETLRDHTISVLLEECSRYLSDRRDASIVILRDGRVFENENIDLYNRMLGTNISVFEYRKRGNPQMLWANDARNAVREPLAAAVPGTTTLFVITAPARNDITLASVAKVTWRDEWNGLGLKPGEIARILAASAAAPGLGLHARHVPAAIYWADGIAGASAQDLRFWGIPVEQIGGN